MQPYFSSFFSIEKRSPKSGTSSRQNPIYWMEQKKIPSWKRDCMEFLMVFAAITFGFPRSVHCYKEDGRTLE
jgi:hypothetical protein